MAEAALHWLRPWWLLALLPLAAATFWWWRQRSSVSAWETVVDQALQPYVIEAGNARRRWSPLALMGVWLLTTLVLAGPVWQQREVPVFEAQQAAVILFDLSASMLTDDIKPNRLVRARFKLNDLLERTAGMQLALIGFSERPYVISPLTDDAATVKAFVPSLVPDIMPVQGSRVDLAIARGLQLLAQAQIARGHLLLVTDSATGERELSMAESVVEAGHRLSVLAVGTRSGSPLRAADGGFVLDDQGVIVVPRIDQAALEVLAKTGGGVATLISSDAQDLDRLMAVQQRIAVEGDASEIKHKETYWIEWGPWCVILISIAALGLFRRGVVW